MEDISRVDVDRIIQILQNHVGTQESIQLARYLKNADIIPKLYQQTYIESMFQRFKNVKNFDDEMEETLGDGYLASIIINDETLNAIKYVLQKSHDRQHEICDWDDAPFPRTVIGSCQYENHYDDICPDGILTDDEFKAFEELNDKYGWQVACERYTEKLNPSNQLLTITLNYSDDETKFDTGDAQYVCEGCMESLMDGDCGGIACDMEMLD